MKFSILPLLLLAGSALAQKAGSPADAPVPIPGDAQAPVSAPQSTAPSDEELKPKALGIIEGLKKYAQVTVMGGTMVDTDLRGKEDIRDGMERVGDANWDELMAETGADDLWVVLIHGQKMEMDPNSGPTAVHLNASKLAKSMSALDPDALTMSKVHYVRMDYMTEPYTCNKWLVFRPPFYVFATNKGQDLRFLRPQSFPNNGTFMHEVVKNGRWQEIPVWKGSFAPGGSYAWIPEKYVQFQKSVAGVPNIAWIGLTGILSQAILKYFQPGAPRR